MKKQTKKKVNGIWRSSFSKISGLRDSGFSESDAVELKNMRPYADGLRLRDGILKGVPLTSAPTFVGSANLSGKMAGFYSDEANTYCITDYEQHMDDGLYVCPSLSEEDFLFNLSGETFLYRRLERQFYMLTSGGFTVAERGYRTKSVRGNRAERNDVLLATSLFDGIARIDFELTAETRVVDLGVVPASVSSVICRSGALGYSIDKKTLLFAEPIPSGSTVSVVFRPEYMSESPFQPYLTGCSSEDDSDVLLHSSSDVYRATLVGGKICLSASLISVSGRLEKLFKCEDRTLAVVGTSVGEVDITNGRIRFLRNGNVRSAKEVCAVGPCAYVYGNGRVERLTVSRSGSEAELVSTSVSGRLFKQVMGETVSLAYSPRDRSLWLLYKEAYKKAKIYVLDEDSGVWYEINGGWTGSPTHLMQIDDGVAVVCEDGIFFSHPEFIQDMDGDTYKNITGEIVLCGTVCSEPTKRKRLLGMGALISGPESTVSLGAETESGRADSYTTVTRPSERWLSTAACRMDVGRFNALTLSAKIEGTSYSVLHEIFAELSV